jgi:hypothetical protein
MACIKPLDEQEWFPGTIRMNVKFWILVFGNNSVRSGHA